MKPLETIVKAGVICVDKRFDRAFGWVLFDGYPVQMKKLREHLWELAFERLMYWRA